jgi:glycosyltransferase involved in cell wall biosynthesis
LCSSAELVQNPEDIDVLVRLGVARAKLRLLGNGIDLARFDRAAVPAEQVRRLRAEIGARPEDVVCGAVGRLVWEKGYAELFEAAAALRRRLPQARFVVVGPLDPDKADGLSDVDLARSRERAASPSSACVTT